MSRDASLKEPEAHVPVAHTHGLCKSTAEKPCGCAASPDQFKWVCPCCGAAFAAGPRGPEGAVVWTCCDCGTKICAKGAANACDPDSFARDERRALDPVHRHMDGSWHFCDETWSDCVGPYATEGECRRELKSYADSL